MAPKGGTFFLLLIVTCAALALRPDRMLKKKLDVKYMAKKMMKVCQNKGYTKPPMALLKTVFDKSEPSTDRNMDESTSLLAPFLELLGSVVPGEDSLSRVPSDDKDDMKNEMMNTTDLPNVIKRMRNSSESSACYMEAFVGPLSWTTLAKSDAKNMDSDKYDALLSTAKPVVLGMPSTRVNFPDKLEGRDMKKWMKMLTELYSVMSEEKKTKVLKWAKEQITQNYFNCTTMPKAASKSMKMEQCKRSLKWLNSDALEALGPFLAGLKTGDVDASPKEKLCEFYSSVKFKAAFSFVMEMKPSLAKKFLQRFQECFPEEKEFAEQLEKLGKLACYYQPPQKLTSDLSKKLLPQLEQCDDGDNYRIKKLKMVLVSNLNISQALQEPGISINLFSAKQLSTMSSAAIKEALKKMRSDVRLKAKQQQALVKKFLGNKKCKNVTNEELMDLFPVAGGLPRCLLKQYKARKILNNTEGLEKISKGLRKGQLKSLLQGLSMDVDPSELVEKLPEPLLRRVSLNFLEKANIKTLEKLKDKKWSVAQASLLVKKMYNKKMLEFRKLRSLLKGITCKMIQNISDSDIQDMTQNTAETAQRLSKVQAGCAARRLFASLEKIRADYFKTITEEEMKGIPTDLLLHLPSRKVKDLPDSVCPVLLEMMEEANLSSLSLRAPSRPALTKKALFCLANGTDLSVLTIENVKMLGPFLCELAPSQLRLMGPDVLNSILEAMAFCQHIPQGHRADLLQLVIKNYGDVANWSSETMEALGFFLAFDDNAISALPNEPWMKSALQYLEKRLPHTPTTMKKKIFDLTVESNASRRKRAVSKVPTAEQIEKLGSGNVFWEPAQLEQISTQTFADTLETLRSVSDYSGNQLAALSKKAVEFFGPVSGMTETVLMQLGCITQGFSKEDLQTLPFSLDTLEEVANCGWKESKMEPVWRAVAKYNNLTAEQLGDAELVSLNQFICGMSSSEIMQINKDAFKEAVDSMNDIQCSFKGIQKLRSLSVSAFGPPSEWTEAHVSTLGNLVAGLKSTDLASLDPPVLSFLSTSSIELIPPENFAALSTSQLMALGPDNAVVVTSEQRSALRDDQKSALDSAITGTEADSRTETPKPAGSGAPALTVEGILSFMKPLLFLLMGVLLL
ncbi:otoancorin [Notolabrus celidotus]|uniref:otoancorin n=1 Tax=Notolabrus celidotus TaxID=1203425 RepID=UPI001490380C|nr:otoancorin [Notolabrus celidotus]